MMREMSYRDKMILLIITVIIIIAVGFFALIRPRYNKMVTDKATLDATQTEWDGIEAKKAEIPLLQDAITEEYNSSKEIAEMFVNELFEPVNETFINQNANYVLEQLFMPLIDESELKVENFSFSGIGSETLSFYYYTPDVLTYSLLESADINGNYAEAVTELYKTENYLAEKIPAEVMTNSLSLSVTGTKEQLMKFVTSVQEYEEAVRINSIDISDYTFGEGQTQTITEEQTDAEGNVTVVTREVPVSADGKGETSISIQLTFYNAKAIDEPELGERS